MAENKFLIIPDGSGGYKFVLSKTVKKFGTAKDPGPVYVDIDLAQFNLSNCNLTIVEDR